MKKAKELSYEAKLIYQSLKNNTKRESTYGFLLSTLYKENALTLNQIRHGIKELNDFGIIVALNRGEDVKLPED